VVDKTIQTQDSNLRYFIENQEALVKKYNNKILVIHNQHVDKVFDDPGDAYIYSKEHYKDDSYMIQRCIPGPEAYTIKVTWLGTKGQSEKY
jgi:CMP-N-acetylneuraminic acid synthetase